MKKDKGHRKPEQHSNADPIVSAQVLLRSRSGKRISPDVPITSKNIAEYIPSPEDAAATRTGFRAAGFEAGEVVGISFSITAPLSRFEQYFGTKLRLDKGGAVAETGGNVPPGGLELPLDRLPPDLAKRVFAVAFSPPAELYQSEHLF